MASSRFVYVTYIRTTPARLWQALTDPAFTRRYWFGVSLDSAWTEGAEWHMRYADGRETDAGRVLEIEPERRLVLHWQHELRPELKEEGPARMTLTIEPLEGSVKLTVIHEIERPDSKLIGAVSGGWPMILSNLKTLLETGETVPGIRASAS